MTGGSNNSAIKELLAVVFIVIIIIVLWIASGGLSSFGNEESTFVAPVPVEQNATSSGGFLAKLFPWLSMGSSGGMFNSWVPAPSIQPRNIPSDSPDDNDDNTEEDPANLPPAEPDQLIIENISPAYTEDGSAGSEYLQIYALETNRNKLPITDLILRSRVTGKQVQIGKGVTTYYQNSLNAETYIFLAPGERAYIMTDRSPIGYSFKVNKCMGYLDKYQTFYPSIDRICPRLRTYPYPPPPNMFNDSCVDFLNKIGSCITPTSYPENLQHDCRVFAEERSNYNRCVTDFSNDADFLTPDWRVYLGRNNSLWKDRREIVDLLDKNKNLIHSSSY